MSAIYPSSLRNLINEISKLPTIGKRSAARLAFNLVTRQDDLALRLADLMTLAKNSIRLCEECYGISEETVCDICLSENRDKTKLVIVKSPQHVFHFEENEFSTYRYHVLHGVISPQQGISPEDLRINELIKRVETEGINELIFALSINVESEATMFYVSNELKDSEVNISQLAVGMPSGGDIEFADRRTLMGALQGRSNVKF